MTATRLPRLPDELTHAIFSETSISRHDLASLALVSRRFLDTVRSNLYDTVPVEVLNKSADIDPDDSFRWPVYTVNSWQLLRTLQDHPNLAGLVKTISLINSPVSALPRQSMGIPTTRQLALVTFLRLARNRARIGFINYHSHSDLSEVLAVVGDKSSITGVELHTSAGLNFENLSQHLPNLTHLGFAAITTPVPDATLFKRLTSIDVRDCTALLEEIPFLSSGSSTLQNLRINLHFIFELAETTDLSRFPKLTSLHMYDAVTIARQSGESMYEDVANLWGFIGLSPSLRALSFDGRPFGIYETAMFDTDARPPTISTLETIGFEQGISFDRIAGILDWPIISTVRRLVLPSHSPTQEEAAVRKRKIDAVSTLCRGTGIEVVLADRY